MPADTSDEEYGDLSENGSTARSRAESAATSVKYTPPRSMSPGRRAVDHQKSIRRTTLGPSSSSSTRCHLAVNQDMPLSSSRPLSEADRVAAMEKLRARGMDPEWRRDERSSDEEEGDEDVPIHETDIGGDPSPYTKEQRHHARPRIQDGRSYAEPVEEFDGANHAGYMSQGQRAELQRRYQPYRSNFPQIGESSRAHDHHYRDDPDQGVKPATTTVVTPASSVRSGKSRRSSIRHSHHPPRPNAPDDVFGSEPRAQSGRPRHSHTNSLEVLADTSENLDPMIFNDASIQANATAAPPHPPRQGLMLPPPQPATSQAEVQSEESKPSISGAGPDNAEAAEILLAISASPAPGQKKDSTEPSPLVTALDPAAVRRRVSSAAKPSTPTLPSSGNVNKRPPPKMLHGEDKDGLADDDDDDDEEGKQVIVETPSRPSGGRPGRANELTPVRQNSSSRPVRTTMASSKASAAAQRTPHNEFVVPELRPASYDPSSSVSRHEDLPLTPAAELQPAADIVPSQRTKPPTYGQKGPDKGVAGTGLHRTQMEPYVAQDDSERSPASPSEEIVAASVKLPPGSTPKTSALRSALPPFTGFKTSSIVTPSRPASMAAATASGGGAVVAAPTPSDFTTFSSPSGLDLTHKLGLAPAPAMPESPTWLEMVRATPDARINHKRHHRPGSMESEQGGPSNPDSPRKRVKV